jgi:hypothetical protein
LVLRFQPRALPPGTVDAYATALTAYPLDVLTESADRLTHTKKFFPHAAEWAHEARRVQRERRVGCGVVDCATCGGRGLVRVCYTTGAPFDLAICRCAAAAAYRRGGPALVRLRFALDDTHDVAPIEAFEALD